MKIFCLGMNYAEHNKELNTTLLKTEEPVIFLKADSCLLKGGKPFFIPDDLGRIDYEAEVVIRISRLGKSIPTRFAHRYYDAATLGIDFTARDLQRKLSHNGQPWDMAKSLRRIRSHWRVDNDRQVCHPCSFCPFISTSTVTPCNKPSPPTCSTASTRPSPT